MDTKNTRRGVAFRMLARTVVDAFNRFRYYALRDATPWNGHRQTLSQVPGRRVFRKPNSRTAIARRRYPCEQIRGMQRPSGVLFASIRVHSRYVLFFCGYSNLHDALGPVLSCLIRSSSSQR